MPHKGSTRLLKNGSSARKKANAKASNRNGARSTAVSRQGRNGSKKLSADELLLRVWQKIYEDHHPSEKVKSR